MTKREVMQMALDALDYVSPMYNDVDVVADGIEALRAELAKPEPEPVALASYSYCQGDDYGVEGPHLALYWLDQRSNAVFNSMHYPNGIDRPKAGFVSVLYRKEGL